MKTVDISETIAASDLKVGRSRHLMEYMNISWARRNTVVTPFFSKIHIFLRNLAHF